MTISLAELLKDSAYKLTQFKPAQIQALESSITMKDTGKNLAPLANLSAIAALVQQTFSLKAESERLLDVTKRAVEIAIEESETAGFGYLNQAQIS